MEEECELIDESDSLTNQRMVKNKNSLWESVARSNRCKVDTC